MFLLQVFGTCCTTCASASKLTRLPSNLVRCVRKRRDSLPCSSRTSLQPEHLMQPYFTFPLHRLHDYLPYQGRTSSSFVPEGSSRSEFRFPKLVKIDIKHSTLERDIYKMLRAVRVRKSACMRACQTEHGTTYDRRRREKDGWKTFWGK